LLLLQTLIKMSGLNNLYPHLLQPDIDLWIRFLALHQAEYERFDYDVRIGKGRDVGDIYNDKIRKMAIGLSQRRIDVVGYKAKSIEIIEITLSAGLKCIGQMETYPILYKETYNPPLPITTLILTEQIESDIEPILNQRNYKVVVLPKP